MPWLFLVIGGLFEIGFTISLKYSENFSKLWPSLSFAACISLSFFFLNKAINGGLPIGTSYAVWTGIGAVGAFLVGVLFYKDPVTILRFASVLLIVFGLIGLKLSHRPDAPAEDPTPAAEGRPAG